MIPLDNLKNLFHLSPSERVEFDAFCTDPKGTNVWCSRFRTLPLQKTRENLEAHAAKVIEEHFSYGFVSGGNPHSLSQYVLNALIDQIEETEHLLANREVVSLDEIVDRAPFGDGTDLPIPPRPAVISLLQKATLLFDSVVWGYQGPHEGFEREVESLDTTSKLIKNEQELSNKSTAELYDAVKELRAGRKRIMKMSTLILE